MKKAFVLFSLLISVLFLSCDLEPEEEQKLSLLEFQKTCIEMNIGDSQTVYIKHQPDGVNPSINYSTSNKGVVSLSGESGDGVVITALTAGSDIVIAKCDGLTAYLEVKVGTDSTYIDPYIVLPYTTLEVERGKNVSIIASLYGGKASDNSQFKWKCDSSCITYQESGNCLNLTAVKSGVARITVEHSKSKYSSSMLVVVPDSAAAVKYLTTSNNVIKVYKGSDKVTFTTEVRGGTEADNLYTNFSCVENGSIVSLSYSNGRCEVVGKECGVAVIRASNSFCSESIDITVIVSDSSEIGYISCDNDFVIIDGNNYAVVTAKVMMNGDIDYSQYFDYEVKDPDIVECSNQGNLFYIYGKKDGITTITLKNKYCEFTHDIMVIVQNNNLRSKVNYISPESNFIKLENNNDEYELKVNLIGGNEADKNNFTYEVSDSSIIELLTNEGVVTYSRSAAVQPETYQTKCFIKPKSVGSANIRISNPKTTNDANVTVVVYPAGTLNKTENTLYGEGVYKVIVDSSKEVTLGVNGDTNNLGTIEWKSQDESICSVKGNGLNGILEGKSSGITELNVSGDKLSNIFSSVLLCGTESELENTNIFYLDKKNLSIAKNTKTYYELKSLSEIDKTKYEISSNDENICKASVNEGVIAIDAVEDGETSLIVTNSGLSDYRYIINVSIYDPTLSLLYPYSITGPDYVGIVLGENKEVEFTLKNAPESEYSKISYLKNNDNISIDKNGNKLCIKALSTGESMIEVRHPSAQYTKVLYVYVAETEEELNERVMFFSEKSNYYVNKGDNLYLKVTSNKEDIYKDIVWSVSDLSKASLKDSGNYALVSLKEEGFVKITASYGNSAFYYFYITIKDEEQKTTEESIYGLPSIVELIVGNTKKIGITSNNLSAYEFSTVTWTSKDDGLEVNGNGAECIIKGNKKGIYELKVESSYLNINKKIIVVVGETAEDFTKICVMNIEKNIFNIKKGEGLEAELLFGSYIPDDDVIATLRWETDTPDIIELEHYANNDKCYITGLKEGTAVIKISSEKFANSINLTVNVYETEESSYGFVTDRIIKIVKGETKNTSFSVINLINNKEIDDYSRIEVKDITNDCISVSIANKNLRIKADKTGTSVITLFYPDLGIETKITVICAESEAALSNIFTFISSKDHYLLAPEQSILIKLKTEDNEDSRIKNIDVVCDNPSVITFIKQDDLTYFVKAEKDGNAILTFQNGSYEYNVYIAVSKSILDYEPQIITENILSLVKGVKYTSSVIGVDNISVYTNSDIIEIENNTSNGFTVNPLECGEGEITVYAGNYSRVLKVVVSENEGKAKIQKIMNIDKRHYYMSLNTSVSIIPGFLNVPSSYVINIEDIYQNNVVKVNVQDKRIIVKAVNPGIAQIKVSIEGYGSVILTFEVNEENTIDGIVENVKYNIYSDNSVVYVEPDSYKTLVIYIDGLSSGESLNDGYLWETDNSSFLDLDPNGYFCNVMPKVSEGECKVTVSNQRCNNAYTFKIKIGRTVENSGTTVPYIYVPVNTVSLKYGEEGKSVEVYLKNMEGYSFSDLTLTDSRLSNVVKYSKVYSGEKCIITLNPVSCGYGRLTLHHPYSSSDSYIDYIVQDYGDSGVIYLTTSDNYVSMKSGETKEINVSLENYEELNGKKFKYEYDPAFIYIIGEGPKVQIQGLKEGITSLKVSHPQSQNVLDITVNISNKNVSTKYFTTAQNVIETSVSSVMDSFMVTLVGDSLSSGSFKYESSDYSVVSVVGQENYCFYRGLSKGQAQITVSHKSDPTVLPLTVTVIVEDNQLDGQFITSDEKLLYLAPHGQNKNVSIQVNNVNNFDQSRLDWSIYSQQNTNGSSGDVIRLNGIGTKGVISPLNEGIAKVRVCYTPLNLKFDFAIFVSPFGEISFSDSEIVVPVGDMYFENINVPSVTNNLEGLVKYRVDNDSICEVFGTSKICCINAKKPGTAIVTAVNTYDNTQSELTVQVYDESEASINKINLNQTSYLLNPRSQAKTLKATLSGKDFIETDKENIVWSISGNSCVNIYPKKGPEVTLSLKADSKTGKVNTGTAVVSVTHSKCGADYKKTVYIDVSELQNYFTLSTEKVNVDSGNTFTVSANILGATLNDYDDVHWSIQNQRVEADGTITTIAQVLNDTGRTCSIMGIEEGSVILNCFYKGDLKTCDIQVKGNRYFSMLTNNIQLFPGQEYKVGYNLRPNTYAVTWFTSCQGEIVSVVNDDHEKQEITLKANKEGMSTITGVVNGIGTVTVSIKVVYNPKLMNTSRQSEFKIPMFDKGTANYNKYKNQVEISYLCYPPEYYVKVTNRRLDSVISEDFFDVIVEQNHDSLSDNPNAGNGKIRIIANREIPLNHKVTFDVKQYSDAECTKQIEGKSFSFTVCSLFTKDDCVTSDDDYYIYFKRYDGGFSMPGMKYDSPAHDMGNIKNINKLTLGEGETHYIIIEPKHKGQFLQVKKEIISVNNEVPLILDDFVDNDGKLIAEIRTYKENGTMRDHGYDGYFNGTNWSRPEKASESFYPRFGIKKPYLTISEKKYYLIVNNIDKNKEYAHQNTVTGKANYSKSSRQVYWNRSEPGGGHENWWSGCNCNNANKELLIFNIPYKWFGGDGGGSNCFPIWVDGNKKSVAENIFTKASASLSLCTGFSGGDGGKGNHDYWNVDHSGSTVTINHDSNYTFYTSKNNCDFNYGNGWIDSIWGKDYVIGEYCRCFPSNNTNPTKTIADELDITIMMNGSTPNPIKYNVELNVYQCYRNYYEYIYDSNGNFTKIINDIANDNFKKISW